MNLLNDIRILLTRWSTAFVLLGVLAVAMAGATLIEAGMNLQAARGIIYNAWWFDLLLLLLCVNFMLIGRRLNLWSRRRWGALLLHYGFVVILAGAFITHMWGEEGYMHIREGETARRMMTPDRKVQTLPFSVTLNRFTLHRYHGSQSPSSYESDVTIRYRDDVSHRKIYMNNIARVGGYRLYQSSYDPDEQGTILSVNHDPVGTAVSYTGYFLLIAGLIVALCQKGSRFRTLYAKLGKATLVVLFAGSSVVAVAAARPATPGGIAPETAERFGRLLLQSSDGRIEPVDSYASEILRKLYHRDSYGNLNANQVLAGILTDRQTWGREPILYIGQNPLPEEACFPDKYVSFDAMFDDRGDYRLKKQVETIYAKPPAHRTKPEQTLLKLDEKVNILYALLNGQMFPIFPVAGSQRWISPGDDRTEADTVLTPRLFAAFRNALTQTDPQAAGRALDAIRQYQQARTPSLQPLRIEAEILYNRADIFRISFRAYLILGGILLVTALRGMFGKNKRRATLAARVVSIAIFIVFALHTFGLGLRSYISGHAPWTNAYESMVYVAWATVLSGIVFARRSKLALALAALLGGVVLFVSNLNWLDPQITPLVPVLKSYWLMIHVSVITASYGFFGICAACGIASLIATIAGKNLAELRIINEMAMLVGLVLLTTGIFFGAVWANESWGRYWGWDPKETWALITMIVYAVTTHLHFIPRLNTNPLVFDVMSVVGFSTVLMTFFGVNYYLSGLHSYGKSEGFSPEIVLAAGAGVLVLVAVAAVRYHKNKKTS